MSMNHRFQYDEDHIIRHFRALRSPQIVTILGPGRKESKLMTSARLLKILRNPHQWGYQQGIAQVFVTAAEMGDQWEIERGDTYHRTIFLDDLTSQGLASLAAWGYTPAAVEETSPGSFQVWILFPPADRADPDRAAYHQYRDALKMDGRRQIERYLVSRLREAGGGGDLRAATGRHTGRLAGTSNPEKIAIPAKGRRPARPGRPACQSVLVDDSGTVLDLLTAQALIADAQAWAVAHPGRIRRRKWDPAAHSPAGEAQAEGQEGGYEDIRILDAIEILVGQDYVPSGNRDLSDEDFYVASRLARAGFDEGDIYLALLEFGPNDPFDPARGKADPEEYLRITAAAAVADPEVAAINAILEHPYDRPEIVEAHARLTATCTATDDMREWFLAGRLSHDGFRPADIKRLLAEDPLRLIRHKDPARELDKTVGRAVAKYPPKILPTIDRKPSVPGGWGPIAARIRRAARLAAASPIPKP